ncbi:hypothetical protein H4582DRAFT_1297062 [Lactarius indigo]|nr:hypothetical protein H4582DRAFT_1297062 [Lactarius indigo]
MPHQLRGHYPAHPLSILNLRSLYHGATQDVAQLHSIVETLPSKHPASGLDHLFIVLGYDIWTRAHSEDAENEDSWLLASYQRGRGRSSTFCTYRMSEENPQGFVLGY